MSQEKDWRLFYSQSTHEMKIEFDPADPFLKEGVSVDMKIVDLVGLKDGRILGFPIPNATAMMLNSSRRAYVAARKLIEHESMFRAPRGFVSFGSDSDAIDFVEEMATSTFAAYTALECFANENIPDWVTYPRPGTKYQLDPPLKKEEIERFLNLGLKLSAILPQIFRVNTPKGTKVWEAFVELEKVRNRMVHLKEEDRRSGDVGTDTIWKALVNIDAPYATAKRLIDVFVAGAEVSPHDQYVNLKPTRPSWHVECPADFGS